MASQPDAAASAQPNPAAGTAAPKLDAGAGSPQLDAGADPNAQDAHVDAAPKLTGKYVALGSSYAAGPSIPDTVPGQSCGRSTRNYAHLVASELGLALTEASCSGAISDNIAVTPQFPNPLQISAVTPDTRLVTITVGGNDVNYALSLTLCGADGAQGRSCLASDVNSTSVNSLLDQIEGKLETMLKAVQKAGPNARVYLVAYPMVLPDSAAPCPPDVPMQAGDMRFLSEVGSKLQAAFSAAAKSAGVHFVDVYGPSHGHDACAPAAQRWIEGQATPGATAYHPNTLGMRAQADLIIAEIAKTP
jgi:lysophospholipase L1-like esterase